jgi:uncharacterized protein
MRNFFALLAGSLFGAGLFTSGMTDTAKVQGWLDLFGEWDPTLAFVLSGAILPMAIAWRFAAKRKTTVLGNALPPKPTSDLSRNLVVGSFLFGAGWALSGLCPGPAMASITYNGTGGMIFLAAMLAGMLTARYVGPIIEPPSPLAAQ